jgi:diguanylate cyclase
LNEAHEIVGRLQRLLAKNLFVYNHEELVITFSGGVAVRAEGEPTEDVIARADRAMYHAKASGKNRVVKAE